MSLSIGTTRASEVMIVSVVTVNNRDKMEDVAKIFEKHDINAAPVLDDNGKCIGIITSHDMVEYESSRIEFTNEINHGYVFNQAKYGDGNETNSLTGRIFDEVAFHMTRAVETAGKDDPLSRVARRMCQKHFHHVIIVDDESRPLGMISSLDILGQILGEPVCRKANC